MKYLKYFKDASAYEAYKNGSDYVTPNVSFIEKNDGVMFNPRLKNLIKAWYNVTSDYSRCFTCYDGNGVVSLTVDGNKVDFEPYTRFTKTMEIFANEIIVGEQTYIGSNWVDFNTDTTNFPIEYVCDIKPTAVSIRAKDKNYKISEKTYVAYLVSRSYDTNWKRFMPKLPNLTNLTDDYGFSTNDGITFEANAQMLQDIQSYYMYGGEWVGLVLCELDEDLNVTKIIDTECDFTIASGGLDSYYFETTGKHYVEIELFDNYIPMQMLGYYDLTNVEISESFNKIRDKAFDNSDKLVSLNIPSSIKYISNLGVFAYCDNLQEIKFNSTVAPIIYDSHVIESKYPSPFTGIAETGVLKYPKGSDYSAWIALLPEGWTTEEF